MSKKSQTYCLPFIPSTRTGKKKGIPGFRSQGQGEGFGTPTNNSAGVAKPKSEGKCVKNVSHGLSGDATQVRLGGRK